MLPLLLAFTSPDLPPVTHDPQPSYAVCLEIEHDIYQGVEFGIISQDQADALIQRCIINYSSGPNAPHILESWPPTAHLAQRIRALHF